MSRNCCVALPHGALGLSAVCDCGISCSYSLTIFGGQRNRGKRFTFLVNCTLMGQTSDFMRLRTLNLSIIEMVGA